VSIPHQLVKLTLQVSNHVLGSLDGGAAPFFLRPTGDIVVLLLDSSVLCVNLIACLALIGNVNGRHDQTQATCFPCAILLGALLSISAPLVVTTCHYDIVIVAHCSGRDGLPTMLAWLLDTQGGV
jgi:hypothetical protein